MMQASRSAQADKHNPFNKIFCCVILKRVIVSSGRYKIMTIALSLDPFYKKIVDYECLPKAVRN